MPTRKVKVGKGKGVSLIVSVSERGQPFINLVRKYTFLFVLTSGGRETHLSFLHFFTILIPHKCQEKRYIRDVNF